ncbi:MAG: cob(I)yrinic acid a,c-diamide adenosyltransferase [Candidatus Heimdallarchaeaceae archaeon]
MSEFEIIYGNGRGKTSNAMGKLFLELIEGKDACVIQFLKTGKECGECNFFQENFPILWFTLGKKTFFNPKKNKHEYQRLIRNGLEQIAIDLKDRNIDIFILDELGIALSYDLISFKDVEFLINKAIKKAIITGRNMPEIVIKKAEKSLRIEEEKHPYQKGILARKGIDF